MTDSLTSSGSSYKTTRLNKGNLPLEEVRILLLNWREGERIVDYSRRLREQGVLDKKTATWTFGLVRMFKGWFESPDDRAARRLQRLAQKDISSQILSELVFLYKARTELIIRDFTVEKFWPAVKNGDLYLAGDAVYDFIHEKQNAGLLNKDLTDSTIIHLARAIIGTLSNVGFLAEEHRKMRELVTYRVSEFSIAYLAYDLHFADMTDNAVIDHPDWGIFGLGPRGSSGKIVRIGQEIWYGRSACRFGRPNYLDVFDNGGNAGCLCPLKLV